MDKTFFSKLAASKISFESQFVSSLYQDTNLFFDFNMSGLKFYSKGWEFFYNLLGSMVKLQTTTIDELTVQAFIETSSDEVKERYKKFGGYTTIKRGISLSNPDNVENYFNEIQRYAVFMKLYKIGMPLEAEWEHLSLLTLDDLKSYFEGRLADCFLDVDMGTDKVEDILDGLEDVIDKADQGINRGLPFMSKLMDDTQNGMSLGHITIMAANSGVGKSFMMLNQVIPSCIKYKEPILLIINEEEVDKLRQEILVYYINNFIPGAKFNKKRFLQGGFTDEERAWLNQGVAWLRDTIDAGLIRVVAMTYFTIDKALTIIKKYAQLYDVKYFVIDTFKTDANINANTNIWYSLMENMRKIYDLIKPSNLNVHCLVTYQMNKTTGMSAAYLDASMLGQSKNVLDVASSLIMMRPVVADEKEGGLNPLTVMSPSGKKLVLNEECDYFLLFWDKNRFGGIDKQVVLRVDRGRNVVRDVGYTRISKKLQ